MKSGYLRPALLRVLGGGVLALTLAVVGIPGLAPPAFAASDAEAQMAGATAADPAPITDIAGWQFASISEPGSYDYHALPRDGAVFWIRTTEGQGTELVRRDPTTGEDTVLVGDSLSPRSFSVDGDRIVFSGYDGVDQEVFVLTMSTGGIIKLTDDLWESSSPQISGDTVTWCQYMNGPNSLRTAFAAYDLAAGLTTTLELPSPGTGVGGRWVDEDWAVWQAYPYSSTGQSGTVRAYSRATHKAVELPELASVTVQVLAEGALYYTVDREDHSELLSFDLASHASSLVAANAKQIQSVQVEGATVAWASWETTATGTSSYVALLDRKEGMETRIAMPGYNVGSISLAGDLVKWHGESSPLKGRGASTHAYIFVYDMVRETLTRLTGLRENIGPQSLTDGSTVVYERYRKVEEGYVTEVVIAAPSEEVVPSFGDVPGMDPYRTAVVALAQRGVLSGYPAPGGGAEFRKDASVTRAQFCKMLSVAMGVEVTEDLVSSFSDLGPDDPASLYPHEYVAALSALGVIKGVGAGRFAPYDVISRAQLVTMLVRAADTLRPDTLVSNNIARHYVGTLGKFDPNHWVAMLRAEWSGLLDGVVGFGPTWDAWKPASRAEAAQMIWSLASMQ